jgi:hypothetical protein
MIRVEMLSPNVRPNMSRRAMEFITEWPELQTFLSEHDGWVLGSLSIISKHKYDREGERGENEVSKQETER